MSFLVILLMAGLLSPGTPGPLSFPKDVQPILGQTCQTCHNEKTLAGGMNIAPFLDPSSVRNNREGWELILEKLRAGEMPPQGVPRPSTGRIEALVDYIQGELDREDQNAKPDPGHVTAHRLNRNEYANTIRDLFGIDIRAEEEFPADDSGYGFDNIGDVLTVSPALVQRYLMVAERISSRVVGGDPLPKSGLLSGRDRVRRINASAIQLKEIVDFDAEYVVRVNLIGHRGAEDKPVTLVISVDGKPVKTAMVPVQITALNQQKGATQRKYEEVRVFLETAREHTFRAEFVNDEGLQNVADNDLFNNNKNIFPDSIELAGPFAPAEAHQVEKPILACDPASGSACVRRILTPLARRAYRRPVTKEELSDLIRTFDKAKTEEGYSPAQSLEFALTAMLVSPNFLLRIEHDPKPGTVARISDLELASRLSYFLWSSMPDEELLSLAEHGKLHEAAVLDAQVKRMIADPKSAALSDNFAGQWLETRSLDSVKPDPMKFPEWGPELKEAMRTETRMFFDAVLREDRPITDFIDGKYTFLNERLAKHYGIAGVRGPEFRRVELTTGERSGVFTQASVLTVSSYPSRTSPVLRGKYLLENVLDAPPSPPPPDVPRLKEETLGVAQSMRQQMEAHRADPVCASCHSRMDVLGFGLENYDAIGRWRNRDGKFPIDASGTFPDGKAFSGPEEMKMLLKEDLPAFTRCLAEKMLTYSLGRGLETYDKVAVKDLVRDTSQHEYRLQALVTAIVHSAPFQQRRGLSK